MAQGAYGDIKKYLEAQVNATKEIQKLDKEMAKEENAMFKDYYQKQKDNLEEEKRLLDERKKLLSKVGTKETMNTAETVNAITRGIASETAYDREVMYDLANMIHDNKGFAEAYQKASAEDQMFMFEQLKTDLLKRYKEANSGFFEENKAFLELAFDGMENKMEDVIAKSNSALFPVLDDLMMTLSDWRQTVIAQVPLLGNFFTDAMVEHYKTGMNEIAGHFNQHMSTILAPIDAILGPAKAIGKSLFTIGKTLFSGPTKLERETARVQRETRDSLKGMREDVRKQRLVDAKSNISESLSDIVRDNSEATRESVDKIVDQLDKQAKGETGHTLRDEKGFRKRTDEETKALEMLKSSYKEAGEEEREDKDSKALKEMSESVKNSEKTQKKGFMQDKAKWAEDKKQKAREMLSPRQGLKGMFKGAWKLMIEFLPMIFGVLMPLISAALPLLLTGILGGVAVGGIAWLLNQAVNDGKSEAYGMDADKYRYDDYKDLSEKEVADDYYKQIDLGNIMPDDYGSPEEYRKSMMKQAEEIKAIGEIRKAAGLEWEGMNESQRGGLTKDQYMYKKARDFQTGKTEPTKAVQEPSTDVTLVEEAKAKSQEEQNRKLEDVSSAVERQAEVANESLNEQKNTNMIVTSNNTTVHESPKVPVSVNNFNTLLNIYSEPDGA